MDRSTKVLQIAAEWWRRRSAGDPVPEDDVIAAHPDLMPELGERMRLLRRMRTEAARLDQFDLVLHRMNATDEGSGSHRRLRPSARDDDAAGPDGSVRFSPGTLVADRFVIYCLLGKGGLGTVYRAHDQLLKKPVALKFFRNGFTLEQREQIKAEVNLAQEVKHLNVCSVHDLHISHDPIFLAMEYIDGEDLDRTLLRVGRFSQERGLEIAAELCRGLAAAHEKGVIHRDLKPQNVMLDSTGLVRNTDFGLARRSAWTNEAGLTVGTLRYMAPEQVNGKTSVRSDIFSLGMVLHVLFTGPYPIELDPDGELTTWNSHLIIPPSDNVPELEPHVERAILHCLETKPADRPASAKAVLAELLDDSRKRRFNPRRVEAGMTQQQRRSIRWLAIFAVSGIVAGWLISPSFRVIERVPFGNSSIEGYRDAVTMLIGSLGYEIYGSATHSQFGFEYNGPVRNEPTKSEDIVSFWYRQSRDSLVPRNFWIGRDQEMLRVTYSDPSWSKQGMLGVRLRSNGRLMEFRLIPGDDFTDNDRSFTAESDLATLFTSAGLNLTDYEQAEELPNNRGNAVQPFASMGEARTYLPKDAQSDAPRVNANVIDHRVVWFSAVRTAEKETPPSKAKVRFDRGLYLGMMGIAILGVCLAHRNLAHRRADHRMAWRISFIVFGAFGVSWLFTTSHVWELEGEVRLMQFGLANALFWSATFWLLHVAAEPFVRNESLTYLDSWTRLLAARWRDPIVARDLLLGSLMEPYSRRCSGRCTWHFASRWACPSDTASHPDTSIRSPILPTCSRSLRMP
jgi:serine/threonine-protein kinase